ncbi:PTS transporter subunit EIIC [Pediococcus siamensis]|uniref:PTS transporter subunit EIIC n=1 Tax=Pediococcus siamensis TaxID=381829 RepID=UPI0039A0E6C7
MASLWLIFPLEFVAVSFHIVYELGFHRNGILEVALNLHESLPGFDDLAYLLKSTNNLTFITVSLLLAFFTAEKFFELRTGISHQYLAGITSLFIYFLLIVETASGLDLPQITAVASNLLIPILIGLLTGFCYSLLSHQNSPRISTHYWATTHLIFIFTGIILLVGALSFAIYQTQLFPSYLYQQAQNIVQAGNHPNLGSILLATFIHNVGHYIGIISTFAADAGNHFSAEGANLAYLAQHHKLWKIPYPINIKSLYDSYGAIGGNGMLLGLVGSILVRVKAQRIRLVAQLTLGQVIFDQNEALMFGIPILFNPLLLIPFLLAPFVTMTLGYLAISFHLVPAAAYVIPYATPSILRAFLGTNGNYLALTLSLLCCLVSGAIYYPFIRLLDQASLQKEGDAHA